MPSCQLCTNLVFVVVIYQAEYGLRLASHIFVKDISPESLAARDGNIQEGDVVLKVRGDWWGKHQIVLKIG